MAGGRGQVSKIDIEASDSKEEGISEGEMADTASESEAGDEVDGEPVVGDLEVNVQDIDWVEPNLAMPDIPRFRARPGVLVDTTNLHSPHDYFRHFLNIDIMNLIAEETNRYATDYLEGHPNLPHFSDLRRWSPIDVTKLENFLGLCLLVGIVKKPR